MDGNSGDTIQNQEITIMSPKLPPIVSPKFHGELMCPLNSMVAVPGGPPNLLTVFEVLIYASS